MTKSPGACAPAAASAANAKPGGRYRASRLQKVRPRGSLKAAVAKLVASVGVERARELTGRGATQLYRYGDPDEAAQMPVDLVAALMRDGGATAVADYLAAEAGCVLLPLTPLAGPAELAAHVGAVGRHVGTAFQDYAEALADGEIDAGERARLIADLDDILQAAAAARADLMDHGEGVA